MFDGLQQGIIVIQQNKIDFMNELSNKVISKLTDQTNFLKTSRKGKIENPLDIKLFTIFKVDEHCDGKSKKKCSKKQAKS